MVNTNKGVFQNSVALMCKTRIAEDNQSLYGMGSILLGLSFMNVLNLSLFSNSVLFFYRTHPLEQTSLTRQTTQGKT